MIDERVLWLAAMMATGAALVAASSPSPVRSGGAALAPIASVAISAPVPDARPSRHGRRIVLDRAPDGLFYIHGDVNGARVRFLIDTGATALILSSADAQRARLRADDDTAAGALQTASGPSTIAWASVDALDVGGRSFDAMPAAILASGLKVSLLGQSVLSKLGPITLDGDRMVIGSDRP